jgi:hypothetical protein
MVPLIAFLGIFSETFPTEKKKFSNRKKQSIFFLFQVFDLRLKKNFFLCYNIVWIRIRGVTENESELFLDSDSAKTSDSDPQHSCSGI